MCADVHRWPATMSWRWWSILTVWFLSWPSWGTTPTLSSETWLIWQQSTSQQDRTALRFTHTHARTQCWILISVLFCGCGGNLWFVPAAFIYSVYVCLCVFVFSRLCTACCRYATTLGSESRRTQTSWPPSTPLFRFIWQPTGMRGRWVAAPRLVCWPAVTYS